MAIDEDIPVVDTYYNKYENKKLHFPIKKVVNENAKSDLDSYKNRIFEYLREMEASPGIGLHHVPSKSETIREMPLE